MPLATVVESPPELDPVVFGLAACGILFAMGLRRFLGTDRHTRGLSLIGAALLLGFLQLYWHPGERTPELGWAFFAGLLNLALGARVLATAHRARRTGTEVPAALVRQPGYTGGAGLLVTGVFLTIAGVLEAL